METVEAEKPLCLATSISVTGLGRVVRGLKAPTRYHSLIPARQGPRLVRKRLTACTSGYAAMITRRGAVGAPRRPASDDLREFRFSLARLQRYIAA